MVDESVSSSVVDPLPNADPVSLFMPSRAGGRSSCGFHAWSYIVGMSLVLLGSLGAFACCTVCFLFKGRACYFYSAAIEKQFTPQPNSTIDDQLVVLHNWQLANTIMFVVSFGLVIFTIAKLVARILYFRRRSRLRGRVVRAMGSVGNRTEANRKLMSGLRAVMELVHDAALRVELTFEGLSYRLRDGTYVLSDASGSVTADEITVLMGPSGCGERARARAQGQTREQRAQDHHSITTASPSARTLSH